MNKEYSYYLYPEIRKLKALQYPKKLQVSHLLICTSMEENLLRTFTILIVHQGTARKATIHKVILEFICKMMNNI